MADDRLDEQPGQRRGDPQARQLLDILANRLEDAAHIRILQREADLDSEKAQAENPQAGKTIPRLVHFTLPIGRSAAPVGGAEQARHPRDSTASAPLRYQGGLDYGRQRDRPTFN